MGGGLFGTPLYLNPKCLVFSGFVLAVYWMPHPKPLAHRILTAFMLATLAYVLLAWYDMIYDCNDKLGPTLLGWLSMPFKPSSYRDQFNQLPVKYQKIVQWTDILILSVLLVLFVYPFIFTKR
jgi:UDP-N-acetylmuramyl pentapeptide phosphotransferase/UDP-N-acetylglucosamine-1-phosphate transferase